MSSHLSRGKLNVGAIQEQARKELLGLLDKCDGSKVIVWDDGLSGPFGLIAEYSLLKKRGASKMYALRPGKLNIIDTENIIFITRPLLRLMNCVADNIRYDESIRKKKKWHLFFVSFKSLLCEEFLKNKGVYGSFTTIEQIPSCIIFPFDNDLMSMEIDNAFKAFNVDGDTTCLYQVAQALVMMEDLFGPIKRISGKGNAADHVLKLFKKLKKEPRLDESIKRNNHSQIDHLLLIDRNIDFLSILATQLTYSGLVDELYGIHNCTVKLPAEKFSQDLSNSFPDSKQLILNSADEIFSEICDKSFDTIGQALSRRARLIASQCEKKQGDRSVQEMKMFVAEIPQILAMKKSLANHTTIAEMIKEVTDTEEFIESIENEQEIMFGMDSDKVHPYIEDCMARKVDVIKVLRLICMQSVVNCGLKPKVLDQYRRDIIQTYGFHHIPALTNLEKVGLLKIQQGIRPFTVLRKTLKLIERTPSSSKDVHFVHGIYAPLTVRLAQQFVKPNGIRNINDVLSLMPGSLFDHLITLSKPELISQRRTSISSQNDSSKAVLVFFIGGCTYAEIAALRFLSQQEDTNVEYVIATTKIINGNVFITSLMET